MKQKPDYCYLTSYQMKRNENLLKTGRSTSHSILAQATLRYRAACMRITKKNFDSFKTPSLKKFRIIIFVDEPGDNLCITLFDLSDSQWTKRLVETY